MEIGGPPVLDGGAERPDLEVTSQEIQEKRIPAFEISTNVIKTEQTHCLITYICT